MLWLWMASHAPFFYSFYWVIWFLAPTMRYIWIAVTACCRQNFSEGQVSMAFNFSPLNAMHIFHWRSFYSDPKLTLWGSRRSVVKQSKVLGVVLDKRLTWTPPLKDLKTHDLSWSSHGCKTYSSATPAFLYTLEIVHHNAIWIATGAFKSSPRLLCSLCVYY